LTNKILTKASPKSCKFEEHCESEEEEEEEEAAKIH
jgi:hypothetical protein